MGDDVIEQGRQCGTGSGTRSSLRREDCGIIKPAVWRRLSLAVIRSSDRLSLRQSLLNVNLDDILHIVHLSSVLCRIYAVALPHLYYVLLCRSPTARAVVSAETDVHDIQLFSYTVISFNLPAWQRVIRPTARHRRTGASTRASTSASRHQVAREDPVLTKLPCQALALHNGLGKSQAARQWPSLADRHGPWSWHRELEPPYRGHFQNPSAPQY
jgi:hypothetical protein